MRRKKRGFWTLIQTAGVDRGLEADCSRKTTTPDRYPTHIVEQMKELGLFGATIGRRSTAASACRRAPTPKIVDARRPSVWMALTGIFNSHLMLALAVEKIRHRRAEARTGCRASPPARCAAASR